MKKIRSDAQLWLIDYLSERYDKRDVRAEHQFCDGRRWRFDVALVGLVRKYAFEIEGGIFSRIQGRHTRGKGYERDMEKYNVAAALGWKVFRFTPEQVLKGIAKEFIERYL